MAENLPISTEEASKNVGGVDRIKREAHDFPPVTTTPASTLVPIFVGDGAEAAWTVQGYFPMIPFILSLPCTMTIYRSSTGELTLFNALRVSADLENAILALGRVAHVVKLGQFHGVADAYWCLSGKFGKPQYWTLPGGTVAKGFKADSILARDNVPVEGATLYQLDGHPFAEAVITVPLGTEGPLLIACDSMMHMVDTEGVPIIGRLVMNVLGFISTPGVPQPSPYWTRKSMQYVGIERVKRWFDDILQLEWRAYVGAHGVHALGCDREAVKEAANRRLGA